MTTKLQKLGNSFALIVPKDIAHQYGVTAGHVFELKVEAGGIFFKPAPISRKRKYTLDELVKGITKKNRHAEIKTGYAVGNEIIDDDY